MTTIPFPPSAPFTRPARVCMALPDFGRFHGHGGIGTAFDAFAHALAKAGHEVTVLLCDPTALSSPEFTKAVSKYAASGIRVIPLPECEVEFLGVPDHGISWRTWDWLRTQTFDVIHFADWKGYGFHCMVAKRCGLDFAHTHLIASTHGPSRWCREGNQHTFKHHNEFLTDHMEQRSVELADQVFVMSLYIAEWAKDAGWKLPAETFLQRNLFLPPEGLSSLTLDPQIAISEIVFFGRFEIRKGLDLFCDAILRLDPQTLVGKQITFLGHHTKGQFDSAGYLAQKFAAAPFPVRILSQCARAEALKHLARPGVLAVIPSRRETFLYTLMECLALQIPALAADTSAVPELVASHDHDRVLFAPNADALAEKLKLAISEPPHPAQCAFDPAENERRWIEWHNAMTVTVSSPSREQSSPLAAPRVSVCITHFNQPEFLRQAIASLEVQTYANFEVILVDDGSTHPAAAQTLDALEPRFASRGWMLIRQENRHVGAARNAAAHAANGEYLMFMDDDNVAMSGEIETFVRAALVARAAIFVCTLKIFTGNENPEQTAIATDSLRPFFGGPLSAALFTNPLGDTNFFIRRELFHELDGFDEARLGGEEDKRFLIRALLLGRQILPIPQPLFWYRMRPDSMSRLGKSKLQERRLTTELFLDRVPPFLQDGFEYLHLRQQQRIEELQKKVAEAKRKRSWFYRIFSRRKH